MPIGSDGWRRSLRALGIGLLDLAWPLVCPLCDVEIRTDDDDAVCSGGMASRALVHRACVRSLARFALRPIVPRAQSAQVPIHPWVRDTPALFRLLHRAKYGAEPALLDALVDQWAAEQLAAGRPSAAVLVPLPDDEVRRRQRGYGVTDRIARRLAAVMSLDCKPGLLRRRGRSLPQARQPDDRARLENVQGRFGSGDLARVDDGRPLLLVEDQVTSGATVREATRLLRARGHAVAVLALAASSRAPRGVGT